MLYGRILSGNGRHHPHDRLKGPVDGKEVYDKINDEIENKEPRAYVFMSKKTEDAFFEYKIQIFEDGLRYYLTEFNDRVHTAKKILSV
jgi:hypothetical protein